MELDTNAIFFHVLLTSFPQYGIILIRFTLEKPNRFIKGLFYNKKLGETKQLENLKHFGLYFKQNQVAPLWLKRFQKGGK